MSMPRSEAFAVARLPSPLGVLLVMTDSAGALRALDWEDHAARMHALLRRQYGPGVALTESTAPATLRQALADYFDGALAALDALPVATAGTQFQREVWMALRQIPAGTTESYGALAKRISRPAAVRAVGAANGANPVSLVLPCHRVIGADDTLTGYGGGLERKRWLLEHESDRKQLAWAPDSAAAQLPKNSANR
jgi:methylated-DNA-[protein]-cysteine S-methyltransferase